jgi:Mrp family chromosome partitioning ATPase
MADLLETQPQTGLPDVLLGNEHWREAVVRDSGSTLDTILVQADEPLAGGEAARRVESMQMQNLLVEARDDYALAVLDAPPISESDSGIALAGMVDAVVLVVESGKTPPRDVHKAISALAMSCVRSPFLLLNRA